MGEEQGELFKEFTRKEGKLKRLTKNIIPRRRPHLLQISLEQAVSIAILVIVGIIISFAMGVEKGKRHSKIVLRDKEETVLKIEEIVPEPVQIIEEKIIEKPYTIQLISYKENRLAQAKVRELERKGMEANVVERKDWFQVCAGSYVDKKDAESDLKKFSKEYKGAFLRNKEE